MSFFIPIRIQNPTTSLYLPTTLMTLEDWVIVNVTGQDHEEYLQGQVTADITKINKHNHLLVANCNPKGKMCSNFILFRRGKGFSCIARRSVLDIQLTEMKKYAVFSKVIFFPDEKFILLGVAGFQSRLLLQNIFSVLPDIKNQLVNDGITTLLWFEHPIERFILVTDEKTAKQVVKIFHQNNARFNDSRQWLALHIEAGIPVIDIQNSGKFIPQATNLHELGGISLKKGCYIGQEIIAKAKFLGINKRSLCYLSGTSSRVPESGEYLEIQVNKNWRCIGSILAAVQTNDHQILVQAVISDDTNKDSLFRIKGDTNILNMQALPYTLRK